MPRPGDQPESSKSAVGSINLTTHPLVAKLHPEPDAPKGLVALVGYLGPSKKPDSIRLYTDLSFRSYFDIPTNGIAHTEPTDAKDENSPTMVLVLPTTQVDVVETAFQSLEASYLQGAITKSYLAGAPLAALQSSPRLGMARGVLPVGTESDGYSRIFQCGGAGATDDLVGLPRAYTLVGSLCLNCYPSLQHNCPK